MFAYPAGRAILRSSPPTNCALATRCDVMPPTGRFHAELGCRERQVPPRLCGRQRHYADPVDHGLGPERQEPGSRFALFYGNRRQNSDDVYRRPYALKNRFPDRLQLHFLFSQEEQEFDIVGRSHRCRQGRGAVRRDSAAGCSVDEAFVCGPDTMIDAVTERSGSRDAGRGRARRALRCAAETAPAQAAQRSWRDSDDSDAK